MIYIDADACPVKDETYKVAKRHDLPVTLVANQPLRCPDWVRQVTVSAKIDEADDWIVEHTEEGDIVIATDIPLADRCIKRGATVLTPTGKLYDSRNIGGILATRNLMTQLRDEGTITGGPAPFGKRDRSRFLQQLEQLCRQQ